MTKLIINSICKVRDCEILALCDVNADWLPRLTRFGIGPIENNIRRHYIKIGFTEVDIKVIFNEVNGKYLRTDSDDTASNKLDSKLFNYVVSMTLN